MANLRGLVEGLTGGLGGWLGRLEEASSRPAAPERQQIFVEPPHQPHIFFTGMVRETNTFCFNMRNTFERIGEQFNLDKQKILWITGYFWLGPGRRDGKVPSYTWWRGLLSKNADALDLSTLKASAKMDYVIPELRDVNSFIEAIEHTFANHHELEEAESAFYSAKQGNKSIKECNILFNALLRPLKLDDQSKCKAYDKAIDPNLVKLVLIRGPWTDVVDLAAKQEITISVSKNVAGVTKFLDPKSHQSRSVNQPTHWVAPPVQQSQQPQKLRDDAMDVDEMALAMKEANFLYADFRQECVDRNICIRCGSAFDEPHYQARGCTLGKEMKMDMTNMLHLWKEWGGSVRKRKGASRRSDSK